MPDGPVLVVFDCDGTLIDSQFVIYRAMAAAFRAMETAPPDMTAVRRVVGLNLEAAITTLLPPGAPPDLPAVGMAAFKRESMHLSAQPDYREPLFPGMLQVIETLSAAGYLLGVATGKARRGLDVSLKQHGLTETFITLQTPDTNPGKPHPAMLYAAMAETGAQAHRTVMIGDTGFDMEMAVAAGVAAIGVSWGYHTSEDLVRSGAGKVIDHYDALPGLVAQLTRGS